MNKLEAKEWLKKLNRLAIGRGKIEKACKNLNVDLLTALKDDDLIVILAEETKKC